MKPIKEKKKPFLSEFFIGFIRIKGVLNWLAISFLGFLLGITTLQINNILLPFLFFMITTFFILAFTFAINNYYDVDTDKDNPRRARFNALASGTISKRTGIAFNLLFIIIPLLLSSFITWNVFLFCALLLLLMWMYSAPPLRLKGRPGADLIWHFFALFALVLWGSYLAGTVSQLSILVAVSFGVFGIFAQLDNHIHDYQYDKASGANTFAVWSGLPTTHRALVITFIFYLATLIPLIILFSVTWYLTILLVAAGIIGSIFLIKIKKSTGASSLYHIINIIGKAVYLNCILYHLSSLL